MSHLQLGFPALGLAAALTLLSPASGAAQDSIAVPMDQVRILTFERPVKTVYVGNPTIADVTVIDSTHIFVLGKSFGTTNLIALDTEGRQAADEQITVLGPQQSMVTLQRGAARTTLNCAAERCEAAPTPGDETEPFETVTGQIEKRQTQSRTAAGQ